MLTLKLEDGQKKAEITFENIEENQLNSIITGIFGVFRVNVPRMQFTINRQVQELKLNGQKETGFMKTTMSHVKNPENQNPENNQSDSTIDNNINSKPPNISRPRVLQKVNEERTLSVSIGEKFGNMFEQFTTKSQEEIELAKLDRDHPLVSGIQIKNGLKCYRVGYQCCNPNCWHMGRRYTAEKNQYVKCHSCGTKLKVRPATENGFPDRDEEGNFFVADELYEDKK